MNTLIDYVDILGVGNPKKTENLTQSLRDNNKKIVLDFVFMKDRTTEGNKKTYFKHKENRWKIKNM